MTLHAVTTSIVELGMADMAGITERHGKAEFSTTAPTEDIVHQADGLQYRLNEGPCVKAIYDDGIIASNDVACDPRWPRWGPGVRPLGVRAALSVHLYTTGGAIGALNLYHRQTQDYSGENLELARILGSHVSIMLAHHRNDKNLWKAVDARHRIGQAQGILMQKYGIDETTAFGVLRRISQSQNIKLHLVADEIIRTRTVPGNPFEHPTRPHSQES